MGKFLSPLRLEELAVDRWKLLAPLEYQSDFEGEFVVPTDFETDLESVPRWLPVAYALLYGTGHKAAVVHDWLYTTGALSRQKADGIMYEALLAIGEPTWKAGMIWAGLRAGGWWAWAKHRKQDHIS